MPFSLDEDLGEGLGRVVGHLDAVELEPVARRKGPYYTLLYGRAYDSPYNSPVK
jgi:hypothetical protein